MRLFRPASAIACAAVLGSACTDSAPVAPRSTRPLTASLTNASLASASHPNREKYRDSGFQPGTGSEGSAVIFTRALLDHSGTTDVEVTTGTFDGGPAPGTLVKVQIKAFSPSGKPVFTDNHDGLSGGGTASFSYTTLPHGTPLRIKAAVGDIAGPGTDDVTARDTVRLRPDLVASRLEGPAQAPIGAPVNIQAFILERNGELGARADCVLYANGTAVDRANGIWVDAGGFVRCSMTHAFTAAGTYSLEARVENVRPRDFDDINNSVTTSINIVAPSDFSTYSFQAWSVADTSRWRAVSTLTTWDGTVETWDQTYTRQGPSQYVSINGLIPRLLTFPITMQGEMTTNGAAVNAINLTHSTGAWVDWQQGYCANSYDFAVRASTYVCAYTGGYLAGYTFVQYDWGGADVRYHSDSYVSYWDPSGQLHERWISDDWRDVAPMVTFGPDFSGRLSVQGADDAQPLTAQATVQLEPVDLRWDYVNPECSTVPVSPGCFELHAHTVGVMGFVDYGSWPPYTP